MFNVHLIRRPGASKVKNNDGETAMDFYIAGNLPTYVNGKSFFLELLRIPGIDHSHAYCSSPYEYE